MPALWGTEERVRELLGGEVASLRAERRIQTLRYPSAEHFIELFRTYFGPILKAFEALDEAGGERLHADLIDLVRRHNRLGGDAPMAAPAPYLEVVATRSG